MSSFSSLIHVQLGELRKWFIDKYYIVGKLAELFEQKGKNLGVLFYTQYVGTWFCSVSGWMDENQ